MAPFIIEAIRGSLIHKEPLKSSQPTNILDVNGRPTGVTIYPFLNDTERIRVSIGRGSTYFASKEGGVIMPGQDPEASVVNRGSVDIFDARKIMSKETPKPVARIIYQEP